MGPLPGEVHWSERKGPEKSRPGEGLGRIYRGRRERGVVNPGGRRLFLIWWSLRVSWQYLVPVASVLGPLVPPLERREGWAGWKVPRSVPGTGWSGKSPGQFLELGGLESFGVMQPVSLIAFPCLGPVGLTLTF